MNRILVVSVQSDIQEKFESFLTKNSIHPERVVYLVEFFSNFSKKKESDYFFPIDDVRNREQIDAAFDKIWKFGPFDAIIHTDEYSVMLSAEMRERLNVKGLSRTDAQKFRDKVSMKQALAESTVRCPRLFSREELTHFVVGKLPVIAKPRSYAGSKGVRLIETLEQLQAVLAETDADTDSFEEFSMSDLEFEEFITGEMYHLDGLVRDGRIVYFQASKYVGSCLSFLKGKPLGSVVIDDGESTRAWRTFASEVNELLRLPDGAFHLEAFLTPSGERIFIEIGIRPGGSLIVPAHKEAGGVDLEEAHVLLQMGTYQALPRNDEKHRPSGG